MSKFEFVVPSELAAKAHEVVERMIEEELKQPDPSDEKAEAAIRENTEAR